MKSNNASSDIARLRWCCRRGMLELDLVLLPFLEQHYPSLNPSQQQAFVKLLDQEDTLLQQWLIKKQVPDHAELAAIVECIWHA